MMFTATIRQEGVIKKRNLLIKCGSSTCVMLNLFDEMNNTN